MDTDKRFIVDQKQKQSQPPPHRSLDTSIPYKMLIEQQRPLTDYAKCHNLCIVITFKTLLCIPKQVNVCVRMSSLLKAKHR